MRIDSKLVNTYCNLKKNNRYKLLKIIFHLMLAIKEKYLENPKICRERYTKINLSIVQNQPILAKLNRFSSK